MKIILLMLCAQQLSAADSTDQPAALSGPGFSLSLTRLLEQFDTNKDGKLSEGERAAMTPLITAAFDLYAQQPKDNALSGIRPSATKILAQTDKLIPLFDKNSDKILDDKEKEQAEFSAAIVQRWCSDFDNNYDGVLDDTEKTRLTKAWNDYLDMLTRNAIDKEEPKGGHQITGGAPAAGSGLASTDGKTDKPVKAVAGAGGATSQTGTGTAAGNRPVAAAPGAGAGNKPAAAAPAGGNRPTAAGAGPRPMGGGAGGGKPMGGQGGQGGKPMAGGQGTGKPGGGRSHGAGGQAGGKGGGDAAAAARSAERAAQKQAKANAAALQQKQHNQPPVQQQPPVQGE